MASVEDCQVFEKVSLAGVGALQGSQFYHHVWEGSQETLRGMWSWLMEIAVVQSSSLAGFLMAADWMQVRIKQATAVPLERSPSCRRVAHSRKL